MKRIEIMANRSVQNEILEGLEGAIENFYYTLVPVVHGNGRRMPREGTSTWPEENFLLIAYTDDETATTAEDVIKSIKTRFPTEGIKFFILSQKD